MLNFEYWLTKVNLSFYFLIIQKIYRKSPIMIYKVEKTVMHKSAQSRASLVVQWLRICLPMQGTWVRALLREDPVWRGAPKPVRHNYWARVPQLLKTVCLESMLRNKRNHRNEKPMHRNEE